MILTSDKLADLRRGIISRCNPKACYTVVTDTELLALVDAAEALMPLVNAVGQYCKSVDLGSRFIDERFQEMVRLATAVALKSA